MAEQQSMRSQELPKLNIPSWLEEAYLVYDRYWSWFWWARVMTCLIVLALVWSVFAVICGYLLRSLVFSGIGLVAFAIAGVIRQRLNAVARAFGGGSALKKRAALFMAMLRYEECLERLGPRQGENDMRYFQMEHSHAFLRDALAALQEGKPSFGHYLRLGESCVEEAEQSLGR